MNVTVSMTCLLLPLCHEYAHHVASVFPITDPAPCLQEFRVNIKYIDKGIHLTRDDYDHLTEGGKHLGPDQEFNREQFKDMMKREVCRIS